MRFIDSSKWTNEQHEKRRSKEKQLHSRYLFFPHLILFQAAFLHHLIPLFLEGDDNKSYENVYKEERKDYKVDDVEDRHLHPVSMTWTSVLLCDIHRMLQNPG